MKTRHTLTISLWIIVALSIVKFTSGDWLLQRAGKIVTAFLSYHKPAPAPVDDFRIAMLEKRVEELAAALQSKSKQVESSEANLSQHLPAVFPPTNSIFENRVTFTTNGYIPSARLSFLMVTNQINYAYVTNVAYAYYPR